MTGDSGKGDARRPRQTTAQEEDLRYDLAFGLITPEYYQNRYNELLAQGKITRNGRPVKHA